STDPPRDTYEEVVMFDRPNAYWQFKRSPSFPAQATVGPSLDSQPNGSSWVAGGPGAIVGEPQETAGYASVGDFGGGGVFYQPTTFVAGDPGDPAGTSEMSVEAWIYRSTAGLPATTEFFVSGPDTGGGVRKYEL